MPEAVAPFTQEIRQHLAALHKRRGLVLTCLVVSLMVATLYNYTTRPVYQATAQILIDRRAPSVLATPQQLDLAELTDLATQLELIRGRNMAEKVVEKLALHKTTEFQTGALMSPWERVQRRVLGRAPSATVDGAGIPLPPAAAAFRSRLGVEQVPQSRLVNLRFRAYDRKIAQDAVNTLAQLYIEQSVDFRFSASSEASGLLGERLKEQEEKVKAAERALQQYREHEGLGVGDDQGDMASQKFATLNGALMAARMERLQKEAALTQVRSTPASQVESVPAILANPTVQGLKAKLAELRREEARLSETLGERHPEMIKLRGEIKQAEDKVQVEIQGVVLSLEGAVQAAKQQEASLEESLEAAKREALDVDKRSVEHGILKRDLEMNQKLLEELMSRAKTTGLEGGLRSTNVRLVERAEMPRAPFSPNRPRNYQLALLLGLALGVGLAILFEQMDNSVKTPDDVKTQLGLPFLGMVPDVELRGPGGVHKLMGDSPQSAVAEAYRVLRTNLLFCSADGSGMIVVVSSSNPGEGKTTTVASLAASLSQNGARVLAVDGDLRRPTLHQHFSIAKSPGLSDLIVGKCQASEAVQVTRFKGLHVLPCGYIPPNPAELLGSNSMKAVLSALKTHYDWVLIDSPPILAMADTPVVCPFTNGLVLVVAAEATTRPAIQRALDQVQSIGGKLIGVVLNKVDLRRNSYYYSQYYGEYYRSYYTDGAGKRDRSQRPARRA